MNKKDYSYKKLEFILIYYISLFLFIIWLFFHQKVIDLSMKQPNIIVLYLGYAVRWSWPVG